MHYWLVGAVCAWGWLMPFSFSKIPASVGCPDLVRVVSACCLFFFLLLLESCSPTADADAARAGACDPTLCAHSMVVPETSVGRTHCICNALPSEVSTLLAHSTGRQRYAWAAQCKSRDACSLHYGVHPGTCGQRSPECRGDEARGRQKKRRFHRK